MSLVWIRWKVLKVFLKSWKILRNAKSNRKIIVNDKEITDPNKIQNEIRKFYETLFKKCDSKLPPPQVKDCFDKVQLPKFNFNEINEYNNKLSGEVLYMSLFSMWNNKSLGNDGQTEELFVTFWEDMI